MTAPPTFNRQPSRPAVWDDRLLPRSRAADLCGTWQLKIAGQFFRCAVCDGNVTQLPPDGNLFDVDYLMSMTLGHMVKVHHYSLSGGPQHGDLAEPA